MSILDPLNSVLLVHAHPDDETIATGALVAEMVARGTCVWLLTATRGEQGEVVPGSLETPAGTEELTRIRELELQRAVETLGIGQQFWLGEPPARAAGREPRRYSDSGMSWIRPGLAGPSDDTDDDALTRAPLAEVTEDVAALITTLSPSLVISYDRNGGYGHPDHVRIREAALAASRGLAVGFAEIVPADTSDLPSTDTPKDPCAEKPAEAQFFSLDAHLGVLKAALRCHATQLTVAGNDIIHSGGQRQPIQTSVGLRLV